jgi:phosphoglycerate-specific signal transduction histidine kinase
MSNATGHTFTITLSEQQLQAVQRYQALINAPDELWLSGMNISIEDAVNMLFSTACAAWMDADPIVGE